MPKLLTWFLIIHVCNISIRQRFSGSHIRPFIRDAVEARLRMIIPYMDKWPQVGDCNHIVKLQNNDWSTWCKTVLITLFYITSYSSFVPSPQNVHGGLIFVWIQNQGCLLSCVQNLESLYRYLKQSGPVIHKKGKFSILDNLHLPVTNIATLFLDELPNSRGHCHILRYHKIGCELWCPKNVKYKK